MNEALVALLTAVPPVVDAELFEYHWYVRPGPLAVTDMAAKFLPRQTD